MRNILLLSIFIAGLLPQVSFGADQQLAACDQKVNAPAKAFFQKQSQDWDAFVKSNPALSPIQNRQSRATLLSKTQLQARAAAQQTFAVFGKKQADDRVAFIQKMRQERLDCISSRSGTSS